jgi:hypothetical protein
MTPWIDGRAPKGGVVGRTRWDPSPTCGSPANVCTVCMHCPTKAPCTPSGARMPNDPAMPAQTPSSSQQLVAATKTGRRLPAAPRGPQAPPHHRRGPAAAVPRHERWDPTLLQPQRQALPLLRATARVQPGLRALYLQVRKLLQHCCAVRLLM